MDNFEYTSVSDQIKKLKEQRLIIADETTAAEMLSLYGYSNIIKSYREPYTVIENNTTVFRSGISFEQIFSLYLLDKNLRNAMMASMQDLEEYIKAAVAEIVAYSFGTKPEQYLLYKNYQNKRKTKPQFTLKGILDKMNTALSSGKDPIRHYREQHGVVPPWILFKGVYFSTIINYIDQFKRAEKITLARKLYSGCSSSFTDEQLIALMMDTLFIALEYRNLAAHGGRIYTHELEYNIRMNTLNLSPYEASGINQVLEYLEKLSYAAPYNRLYNELTKELTRHCSRFPQDITYLAQALHINITISE